MQSLRQYGPVDDVGITDGDTSLVGVNTYDAPENLQPGQVQEAINMDFTSQDATTRGGFVCLPSLGSTPFGYSFIQRSITGAANVNWSGVAYGNGIFVAVSVTGSTAFSSNNGITWAYQSGAIGCNDVAFGNGMFVAVGPATTLDGVMTSTDGINWTARTSASNQEWYSICYGGGQFVAISNDVGPNNVMTSPDGITWTARSSAGNDAMFSVVYGNGLYVAVADNTQGIQTSPDGITWTRRTTPTYGYATITYGIPNDSPLYVAVGYDHYVTGTGIIATSPDGITWTARTAPTVSDAAWQGSAYLNGAFCAITNRAGSTAAMFSIDAGVTWFLGSTPSVPVWFKVASGNGTFVSVASATPSGDASLQVMTSTAPLTILASGTYSDPNETSSAWIVLVGLSQAGFFSFGQTPRYVSYPANYSISQQSTIVQANNLLFIFSGPDQSPIQWDGTWGGAFVTCPVSTLGVGYENIPFSNQATYSQNRLWVTNGKDTLSASQALDFANFNVLTGSFNLNYGASDYIVCSYPFGNNGLVVFKNRSVFLLQNTEGSLTAVTNTEITRQIGIIGINAVTAVGPDLVYMTSDRNITSIRLNIQNATQAVTIPISQNINPIMRRVNWTYGYKVSMGYWNNLLFVALPLDNATVCNTVLVYNFITNNWYGEWTFDASLNMGIQGFITSNYLGQVRMHAVTEDGRIFVMDEGQNDISGTTVAEISTSLTTRAYACNNENRYNRRMFADLSTNRPNFSVRGYVDGVNEYSDILTNQTYLRSQSWRFPAPAYEMDNSDDDFNQAFRKDYSTGPDSIQCGTGFLPEATQDYRIPLIFRRNGRLVWYKITNTTGLIKINSIGGEARAGMRNNLVQTG